MPDACAQPVQQHQLRQPGLLAHLAAVLSFGRAGPGANGALKKRRKITQRMLKRHSRSGSKKELSTRSGLAEKALQETGSTML
jgi:hypothetical protein